MQSMLDDILGNGVREETGGYGFPPMPADLFGKVVTETPLDEAELAELQAWIDSLRTGHYGLEAAYDQGNLAETGWGVIFAHGCDPAVREALAPLLELRREQAGPRYREYWEVDGYRPGDSKLAWLGREPRRVGPGPVDPERMPYYLLIVGDPQTIPFLFQVQLDVQFAVGRVCFDTPAEYAAYARSVVRAERENLRRPRQAAFFGPANPGDRHTRASFEKMVGPLASGFCDLVPPGGAPWTVTQALEVDATKARLRQLLGGSETPALLFTATHGLEVSLSNLAGQRLRQGALVCQDWPGPGGWQGGILPKDFYFAGDDLGLDAQLWGAIAFFFACFSAGTPRFNEFVERVKPWGGPLAEKPFAARLPQQMLSHPAGGALAVIGHVDRAWGYSFDWPGAGPQLPVFQDAFYRLLAGERLGAAFEGFNQRYGELATELSALLQEMKFGYQPTPEQLPLLWTANNDAKNYVILGDPAVRLAV